MNANTEDEAEDGAPSPPIKSKAIKREHSDIDSDDGPPEGPMSKNVKRMTYTELLEELKAYENEPEFTQVPPSQLPVKKGLKVLRREWVGQTGGMDEEVREINCWVLYLQLMSPGEDDEVSHFRCFFSNNEAKDCTHLVFKGQQRTNRGHMRNDFSWFKTDEEVRYRETPDMTRRELLNHIDCCINEAMLGMINRPGIKRAVVVGKVNEEIPWIYECFGHFCFSGHPNEHCFQEFCEHCGRDICVDHPGQCVDIWDRAVFTPFFCVYCGRSASLEWKMYRDIKEVYDLGLKKPVCGEVMYIQCDEIDRPRL